jgi:hypothetical protein
MFPSEEFIVYVLAPLPFMEVVPFMQITELADVALIIGSGLTVILTTGLLVLVQFAVLVPDTV